MARHHLLVGGNLVSEAEIAFDYTLIHAFLAWENSGARRGQKPISRDFRVQVGDELLTGVEWLARGKPQGEIKFQ